MPGITPGAATRWTVCPRGATAADCQRTGDDAIQAAVDAAADGDTIEIRAGTYAPTQARDVPFGKLIVRGYVVIDGRELELKGERGAVIDGTTGAAASAIVTRGGKITISHLALAKLRAADPEDDIYDGHGLFSIDSALKIEDLTVEAAEKMALTVRGHGTAEVRGLRVVNGHVGIWLEETARLTLIDAVIEGNSSAGLCAYGDSVASVDHSLLAGNGDDGVFTDGRAHVDVGHSIVVGNRPFGARAAGQSRIRVTGSVLSGNAERDTTEEGHGRVDVTRGVGGVGPKSR